MQAVPQIFFAAIDPPDAGTVGDWARLVEQFGGALVVGVTLSLFFLALTAFLLWRFIKVVNRQEVIREGREASLDRARVEREASIDEERKQLLGQVLALTQSGTEGMSATGEAIRAHTETLTELRRDVSHALDDTRRAIEALTATTKAEADETNARVEALRLANSKSHTEITERLRGIETRLVENDDRPSQVKLTATESG